MTDISLDLSGKLDPLREQVFRDVLSVATELGLPFFVVGACARDLILDLHYGLPVSRATNDIDFGIRVGTWGEFEELKRALTEMGRYAPDPYQLQRLHSRDGMIVDIVPFGGVEDATTRDISWPPRHLIVMSALGFEEAYQHSIRVRFAAGLEVPVSSLAGLALMKLVAWRDRHKVKDAKDLKLVLSEYLRAGNEERLESGADSDLLDEENFATIELTSARLLGRDLGLLLTERSRQVVLTMLEGPTELAAEMAAEAIEIDEAFEAALQMLGMLKQGILDAIRQS